MRPLARGAGIAAFAFDEIRILHLFHHLPHKVFQRILKDLVAHLLKNGFARFDQMALLRIRRRGIEPLHTGDMAGGEMPALIRHQLFQLFGQYRFIPLLVARIEYIVMRVRMMFVAQAEGQSAAVPIIPPFVTAHAVAHHAIDVKIIAEAGQGAEPAAGDARSVRTFHDEFGLRRVDAAVENNGVDVKTAVDLRHLRGLSVRKRRVADFADLAPFRRQPVADHQIAHQRFTVDDILFGK
ncbi:MAG: hypothetical protein BWY83_02182 [bacterium ADurb.Bin478]|nr:MAG: hypothetical protein BWY83_02182 [bacterium ADurb.Bin478]